jgi:hypothetical protein
MPDRKPRTLNSMTAQQIRGSARSSGYVLRCLGLPACRYFALAPPMDSNTFL